MLGLANRQSDIERDGPATGVAVQLTIVPSANTQVLPPGPRPRTAIPAADAGRAGPAPEGSAPGHRCRPARAADAGCPRGADTAGGTPARAGSGACIAGCGQAKLWGAASCVAEQSQALPRVPVSAAKRAMQYCFFGRARRPRHRGRGYQELRLCRPRSRARGDDARRDLAAIPSRHAAIEHQHLCDDPVQPRALTPLSHESVSSRLRCVSTAAKESLSEIWYHFCQADCDVGGASATTGGCDVRHG